MEQRQEPGTATPEDKRAARERFRANLDAAERRATPERRAEIRDALGLNRRAA